MRFGLSFNPRSESAIAIAKRVLSILEKDHEVVLDTGSAEKLGNKGTPLEMMRAEVLITVGGDGTILRALQRSHLPILGINTSVVGFLTEVGADDVESALKRVVLGDYFVEERLKLKTLVDGRRLYDCTNEAVIHTAHLAKIRHYRIWVDKELASDVEADGIIVATPTGSTAYAMSVGGPIVDPRVRGMVVAAIAPFRLSMRPIVVPSESEVRVEVAKPQPCVLVLDGQHEERLEGNEELRFGVSENRARFIRFRSDFYRRIDEKLMEK